MAKATASERGPRNAKLTLLVPQSLLDDLRALREATLQSTGDLVNRLIEAELERQADALEEGRELVRAKEERAERAKAKSAEASGRSPKKKPQSTGEASGEPTKARAPRTAKASNKIQDVPIPTADDLLLWTVEAANPDDVTKRKADGEAFLSWLESEGHEVINSEILSSYREVLGERYPNIGTAKTHMSRVNGFVRWIAERQA